MEAPIDQSAVDSATTSTTPVSDITLFYRMAQDSDLPQLIRYREECGWGVGFLKETWQDPNVPLCIFMAEINGETVDIGMGGWILEQPGAASKKDGWVKLCTSLQVDGSNNPSAKLPTPFLLRWSLLSVRRAHDILASLFILKKYQKFGYGRLALNFLEKLAVDLYGAKVITLDTAAYECTWSEDGKIATDNIGEESNNSKMYKRRGYVQYKDPVPSYPFPRPDDPDYKIHSVYFKKVVQAD
ncbi:hypothetical protein BCR39DRAFT_513539 [Naematelia encephala]|uniref:N-acetyltransferase domain-containing protein n=1 Tax=Naematelia encephala TaxID=71784 RepID=A0A1Y2BII1_9TREE|nr:hypothetical protein BCR39DRAFT_513539 [Naematelia encephala]